MLHLKGGLRMKLGILITPFLPLRSKLRTYKCSKWSLKDLFDFCNISSRLRRDLYGHGAVFAENESNMSCVAYGSATCQYHEGADYPRFGFKSLISALSDIIY